MPLACGVTLGLKAKPPRKHHSPLGDRLDTLWPGRPQGLVSTYSEGIICKSILQSSSSAPGAPRLQALAAPAPQGLRHSPPKFGVSGDPLTLGRTAAAPSHLIGPGGLGGPRGGAGRSKRQPGRWAAACTPARSGRAPAEAMRATPRGARGGAGAAQELPAVQRPRAQRRCEAAAPLVPLPPRQLGR